MSAYDLRDLPWAYASGRVCQPEWGAARRGCHTPASLGSARFARSSYVNRALFGTRISIDLHRPMAWFPGAYDLPVRTLSWAYGRVWGAAGRGCHPPASPGSARFARSSSSYVNRALFGISTADEAQRCRTRVARAEAPKWHWQAITAQLACASGCPWPGRRDRALGAAARLLQSESLRQLGARQQKALRLGVR